MSLTKVKINLGTQGNLSGSRSIIQSTKTLVSGSAQIASNISGSFTSTSSSIASGIAGNVSSINTLNGSGTAQGVGTSDSPTFNNITATGTLTAQEIHTEFTSASIVFTSGSTKTGNSTDDIHQMTGSLNVSGSLTLNDGTLTVTDNVDFNGDLDVDGTTNLDDTDIDGTLTVQGSNYTTLSIQAGSTTHGAILNLGDSGDIDYGSITQFASGAGEGGRMRFIAGTTETMNLRGGRVGIGDSNPGSPLDVKSGEAANTANFNSTSGATNITFESNGSLIGQMEFSGPGPSAIVTRTSASLALGSNNVRTLYITDDDLVGIGQGSPTNSPLEVNLTQSNGTTGTSGFAHFGSNGNTDGYIQGISLGYRESNANYRKIAIAARGRGDGATRSDLVFLVDTANDQASATLQDAKLTIDGLTGATTLRDGIRFNATNGADPAGDDHLDVPIKFAVYTEAVDSTDVSNGSVDLDLDIYRDNYLSLNALLFDSNTNVVHAGLSADESWLKEITVYASGGVRVHFGSSVAAGDTVKLLVSYTGNTG